MSASADEPARDRAAIAARMARLILQAGAVRVSHGPPFMLAAGWASPAYIDCRVLIGDPALRREVVDLALARLKLLGDDLALEAIAGAETAGIPFAAWLADRLALRLRYVRKRSLGLGRDAQVEGGPVDGLRLLLVDDLTTDAASKLGFVRGLRAAGAEVEHILTLFYHDVFPGVAQRLADAGLRLHPLATWADILQAAPDAATLSEADLALIRAFLADPVAWSTRHGGRGQISQRG